MRSDVRPGGVFPDYSLPDHTGAVRTLSELQGRDPLILLLAPGNYCPKSTGSTWSWAANQFRVAVAYTQIGSRKPGPTPSGASPDVRFTKDGGDGHPHSTSALLLALSEAQRDRSRRRCCGAPLLVP